MVLSKDLFMTLFEEVQKHSWKQSLIFVGLSLHVKYALCPTKKNSPPVQCLCIVELVPTSTVEVVPWEAYEENLASILSEKATTVIKRVKGYEHTSQCVNSRKRRTGNLSRFYGTPLVILSQWLVAQTWLNSHKTWQAHSSLKLLWCLKLVWGLVE